MTEQEVFARLCPLVSEVTGVRGERIEMDSGLIEDLGAASLDLLDLSFLIEEEFGVVLPADGFEQQVIQRLAGGAYEEDGLLTEQALAELRKLMPEVPLEKLQPPLPKLHLPQVLNVAVLVHLIQREQSQAEQTDDA